MHGVQVIREIKWKGAWKKGCLEMLSQQREVEGRQMKDVPEEAW